MFEEITGVKAVVPAVEHIITIPEQIIESETTLRNLFGEVAGEYMGRDKRKGHTFSWISSHLADAKGRVSIRSFIIALREAARATPTTSTTSIGAEGIRRGVQAASLGRVEQLKEDYAWIEDALTPLEGLRTPNTIGEFMKRWESAGTVAKIQSKSISSDAEYMGPVQFAGMTGTEDASSRLLEALRSIGVVENRKDGRVNMPDLFQVAAGLLRKGGLKPLQQ